MPAPVRLPEIIGHRGAPRERVENTLPAFAAALAQGADAVELDVHATSDGTVVVHHDFVPRTVDRGRRPIAAIASAELRDLRFEDGSSIPTLDEVLELLGKRATAYVELKGRGIEAEVLAVLARHETPAAVHSFDHRAVLRAGGARPGLARGVLLSSYVVDAPAVLRAAGARDLWQEWEWIDQPLVDAVHDAGGRVIAWTANAPDAVRTLAAMGVDALCTDVPGAMRQALG